MRQKLNIITLGVDDLDRALGFYERGLGWQRSEKSTEHIVFFPLGGMVLALYSRTALAEDVTVEHQASAFAGITLAYNAKSTQEVDEVLARVAELGATILKPAQEIFWGGYSGYFRDLDGHVFEVAHNPFVSFDKHDNLVL